MKLTNIFLKNILHIVISSTPVILFFILVKSIVTDTVVLIFYYILCAVFFATLVPIIKITVLIAYDILKKEEITASSEVEGIRSGWRESGLRRKYIFDIFSKNYTCVYEIFIAMNDKYCRLFCFIPKNQLDKINFSKFYELNYEAYKEELIIPKKPNLDIWVDVTFYRASKVVKNIKFYVK